MKMTNFFEMTKLTLIVGAAAMLLVGCADTSKDFGSGNMDGSLPVDSTSGDNIFGTPVNERPEGIDPDKDVDYSILAAETIYFDYDSSSIKASERVKLEKISKWLTENSAKRLMLAGHTDARGTLEYNRGLGERRALAVREYLIGLGIPAGRLFTISYGKDRPASNGNSDTDHNKNRRVVPGVITK